MFALRQIRSWAGSGVPGLHQGGKGQPWDPNGAYTVVPSCLRGMQPSAGGLQDRARPPWLLQLPAWGHKPKGNVHKLPHVMTSGILPWKESNLPLLRGPKCSGDVAGGGLEPLTLTISWLAVLQETLVALSPTWTVCLSSSCSCQILLLPPPSPSLRHHSLSQPATALLSAAEGQR